MTNVPGGARWAGRLAVSVAGLALGLGATFPSDLHAQITSRALGHAVAWQVVVGEEGDAPTISGIVLDGEMRPLAGVLIAIDALTTWTASDPDGRFRMPAPPGEWVLRFSTLAWDEVEERVVIPGGSGLRVVAILARERPICSNACIGTWCEDLGILVVDAVTGQPPTVPVRLRVEFEGQVEESVTTADADPRAARLWIGLGKAVTTVGWHTIEVTADGYHPWRRERVWLERVPWCHGHLIGREHRAELVPIGRP